MWVKICANTSVEDAQSAIDLGADAIGYVFAPSKRRVTPEQAGAITAGLRGDVERIGVFHEGDFEAIRSAVRVAGLTGVQLHGGPWVEVIRRLREEFGGEIGLTQTLHWVVGREGEDGSTAERLAEQIVSLQGMVDRVLVDSKVGAALGGTGRSFDWEAGRVLFAGARKAGVAIIVAGGLDPENIGSAIERLQPWGVDVASGVELEPGRKDPERLRLFIERARAAGQNP
jgi:phosphoribosylanthranilate isomerase